MSSVSAECQVCDHDYDSGDRKPLFLKCGHCFCRLCLNSIFTASAFPLCPTCRVSIPEVATGLDSLPVCYMLIPSVSTKDKLTANCQQHKEYQDYWCHDCRETLCKKCLPHHSNHTNFLLENLVRADPGSSCSMKKNISDCFVTEISRLESLQANLIVSLNSVTASKVIMENQNQFINEKLKLLRDCRTAMQNNVNSQEARAKCLLTLQSLSSKKLWNTELDGCKSLLKESQTFLSTIKVRLINPFVTCLSAIYVLYIPSLCH